MPIISLDLHVIVFCIPGSLTTWIRLSISHSDTDPERTRAPAARDRPGGSSTPTLLLCSYPRRGLATLAWSELGELLRPEQIHRCDCVLAIP